jgi:hypothetical protein
MKTQATQTSTISVRNSGSQEIVPATTSNPPEHDSSNTMAVAGTVLCVMAAMLYGGMFFFASQLPDKQQDLITLRSNTPLLLRPVILGGSAALLNLVSLSLSLAAFLQGYRKQRLALVSCIVSGLLLLGIAFVILLSTFGIDRS